jgi:hypothetical protein
MLNRFLKLSGFKKLAEAQLTSCEYSLVLYILNTAVSDFPQIITNEEELAIFLGRSEKEVTAALESLSSREILKIRYSEKATYKQEKPSMMISFNFETSKWFLPRVIETQDDARIYPFRRGRFHSIKGGAQGKHEESEDEETYDRIFRIFTAGRTLDENEISETNLSVRHLIDSHPVDQVLLLIRHFGLRIPTLSLLASNWQHFTEQFIDETQSIDMMGARQKHLELDSLFKERCEHFLESATLEDEEKNILQILIQHRHPRRQLFWAFQSRSRYPGLQSFFEDNSGLMLGVTSTGTIVKNKV